MFLKFKFAFITVLFIIDHKDSDAFNIRYDYVANARENVAENSVDVHRQQWLSPSLFEGDIQVAEGHDDIQRTLAKKPSSAYVWPGAVIPFDVSEELAMPAAISVLQAVEELQKKTCLRFVAAKSNHQDKLLFDQGQNVNGCYSNIGRQGGVQRIVIAPKCSSKSLVLHLVMHTLGFWHEHSRLDRQNHISFVTENIADDYQTHFKAYTTKDTHHEGVEYDLRSILHIPLNSFSIDPHEPTIKVRPGGTVADENVGYGIGLSASDVLKINRRYCVGWEEFEEAEEERSQLLHDVMIADQSDLSDYAASTAPPAETTTETATTKKKKSSEEKKDSADERRARAEERREERKEQKKQGKKKGGRNRRDHFRPEHSDSQQSNEVSDMSQSSEEKDQDGSRSVSYEQEKSGDFDNALLQQHLRVKRDAAKRRDNNRRKDDKRKQHGHVHTHHKHHVSATERHGKKSDESILKKD